MDRQDLDETRRLLYVVLAVHRTNWVVPDRGRHTTVATLVNALVHHQGVGSADDVMARLISYVERTAEDDVWLLEQIDRVNAALEG